MCPEPPLMPATCRSRMLPESSRPWERSVEIPPALRYVGIASRRLPTSPASLVCVFRLRAAITEEGRSLAASMLRMVEPLEPPAAWGVSANR